MFSPADLSFLGATEIFGQSVELHDLAVIGFLIVLEGVLSIDNALVLGILARRLPKRLQSRALTYGLVGAFVFRLIAIGLASYLLQWRVVKLLGGAYLVYVAVKHFFFEDQDEPEEHVVAAPGADPTLVESPGNPQDERREAESRTPVPLPETVVPAGGGTAKFWPTVAVIELTDIAFAVDSILAAIALVGSAPAGHKGLHPKLWVVVTGGMLGVILMRFAAVIFIKLLEKFPRFEVSAYLLVIVIGGKLLVDWYFNTADYAHAHPQHPHRINFHDFRDPAFWIFWGLMLVCFGYGFIRKKDAQKPGSAAAPR
jgi:YkoY family integral membrane protein